VSTPGALALRGGGLNDHSRQDAGCLIWPLQGGEEVPRDGLPRETLSKAFFLFVLTCLVLAFLYLIFGLNP
jgi:hypothetical protein